jgi:uroporphyrin-III C-methyltransferase
VAHVTMAMAGRVYLVGAGPGDPELLTRKAADLLATADIVLHDDLVPQAVLAFAGNQALVVSVGKRCGAKHATQSETNALMVMAARSGQSVVRLKSGDPLVFGRAAEEMDALRAAEVPFEIIPGVTAASSAAAFVEASLTDRRVSSRLIVLSGHRTVPQQDLWSGDLPADATLAIYMPGQDLHRVAASLLRSGLPGALPCVAVKDASRPEASYTASRLGRLADLPSSLAPTLLLVGHAFEAVLCRGSSDALCPVETQSTISPPLTTILHP